MSGPIHQWLLPGTRRHLLCSGRFFIYQINEEKVKCHLHWPTVEEVPDVEKTGEVWSLVPTPVTKIGYVDVIEDFTGEKHYETHIYS